MNISPQFQISLLEKMKLVRTVEEGIAERYHLGLMRCPTHLSIGQEASAVGISAALTKEDLALSTHRAHAHYLAKGGDVNAMLAEIYGKAAGCCSGKGGSMHLIDRSVGFMGSTAIVGNSIPLGVGLGFSLKQKKSKNISVIYFGDGATEEGAFYEAVNFAIIKKLPVLFVCENNLYSVYSPLSVRQPAGRVIHKMVEALGMKTAFGDGNNVEETYNVAKNAIEFIHKNEAPFFIELTTYRWREHCGPDYDNSIGYRTEDEFQEWMKKDPVKCYEEILLNSGIISHLEIEKMDQSIKNKVNSCFTFAEETPFPDESLAYKGLYA
uniref:thiamine pyrophosphate-dependent dehydrogenase E1 component subunit alpha n=1 Tax=Algoriphagus sp. TaxID=1872435 RepID=UPI00404730A8